MVNAQQRSEEKEKETSICVFPRNKKNSIKINGRNYHTKNKRESQRRVRSYLTHSPSNVSQL